MRKAALIFLALTAFTSGAIFVYDPIEYVTSWPGYVSVLAAFSCAIMMMIEDAFPSLRC